MAHLSSTVPTLLQPTRKYTWPTIGGADILVRILLRRHSTRAICLQDQRAPQTIRYVFTLSTLGFEERLLMICGRTRTDSQSGSQRDPHQRRRLPRQHIPDLECAQERQRLGADAWPRRRHVDQWHHFSRPPPQAARIVESILQPEERSHVRAAGEGQSGAIVRAFRLCAGIREACQSL